MLPIRDHNPSTRWPLVTWTLMAANIAIHLLVTAQIVSDRDLYELYYVYGMVPARISGGDGLTGLVTSVFLHADFLHLAGNMLFLWIFGDNLEDELGHLGFLIFYLLAGAAASGAQWLAEPYTMVPTIGASGAIAGVMGAYLLLFPKAKVDIFVFLIIIIRIIPVPAWLMLGLWFLLQLSGGLDAMAGQGGVAYWAHAGGFLIGMVLILPSFLRRGGPAFWNRTRGHPPHPDATYGALSRSSVPAVRKGRNPWG